MEHNFKVGDLVVSTNGHDKNKVFIVVSIDKNGYLAIINGRQRKIEKPKFKNPKHIQKLDHNEEILKLVNSRVTTNAEIFKQIKKLLKRSENV